MVTRKFCDRYLSIFYIYSRQERVKSTPPIDKMGFTPIGRFELVSNLPQCSLVKKLRWLPTPGLPQAVHETAFPRNINAANADLDVDHGPPIVMAAVCSEGGSASSIPVAHRLIGR